MKFIGLCIAASLLVGCAVAQDWDDLRVRFGMNPLSNFVQMPRTVADATSQGFKQETNCDGAANKFLGRRFVHRNGDRSIMLLYDVNGIIAGIQTNVPKSTGFPTAAHKKFHDMWVEEPNAHVLTAYFVDPHRVHHRPQRRPAEQPGHWHRPLPAEGPRQQQQRRQLFADPQERG
ncbi:hypothetical protein BOX15_Mlig030495g1 [Macrostomum lignano]|uniref:Uncharacterized protein n=1 Tax=Macrostomum lignano TaxID=282301 RepID=A0A267F8R2_9PLAT|nr:hypothetical protein BOX15_Mlig030495g1 [Macrostomum lignano]